MKNNDKMKHIYPLAIILLALLIAGCKKEEAEQQFANLGLSPSANAELGCSYLNWNPAAYFRVDLCCFPDVAAINIDNSVITIIREPAMYDVN